MPERYFFRFTDHLLELDALEMDSSLRYVLRDVPNQGSILVDLQHNAVFTPKTKRARHKAVDTGLLVWTVDHDAGIVQGDGLGKALEHFRIATADDFNWPSEWLIESVDGHATTSSGPPQFRLYPPHWMLTSPITSTGTNPSGRASENIGHASAHEEGAPKDREDHAEANERAQVPMTIHREEATLLLRKLASLPSVSNREVDLHRQAVRLSLRSGFDELLSLQMLRDVTPFPHQVRTVERVLRRMRGRALLCDEVGLGKTIEAGIVLTEYMLRGLVKRALILTPASLVEQWKEEVTHKLGLDFACYDDVRFRSAEHPWHTFEHIIASIDTAKREPHRSEILDTEFDLVIVDEAHHLKNKATLAWKFVNQLKKKYILLLTAAPIENDMSELFNLITLLKPGQLLTEAEYKRRYVDKKDPLQPRNVSELKQLVQTVMIRNRRSSTGVIQSTRTADTIVIPPHSEERQFYEALSRFVKSQLQSDTTVPSRDRPPLHAQSSESRKHSKIHPFVLKNLLRQAGSSIACTLPTLTKWANKDGNDGLPKSELWVSEPSSGDALTGANLATIQDLIQLGKAVRDTGKLEALLKLLQNTPDQTVVFTGFVETQSAITDFLRREGVDVVNFHGGMSRSQKEQAINEFRDGTKVLISTESGGEGRNLQFCHRMVNFDIPWNPMRIEQRIGRIHRIGQEHEVSIYNLASQGTMEEHILRILDAKVNLFQLVVGELDMILGSLDEKREFDDILMDIFVRAQDESELAREVDAFGEELLAAKTHYQKVRDVDDRLLSELIVYE